MILGLYQLRDKLLERSGGRLKLDVFPALGLSLPWAKHVSAVRDRLMDVGELTGSASSSEWFEMDLVETPGLVPFDQALRSKILSSVLGSYYEKMAAERYNQIYFGAFQNDPRQAFIIPAVRSLDDLKGKKIRASGAAEALYLAGLGAQPTTMSTAEFTSAMQSKVIDGALSTMGIFASGTFIDIAKYLVKLDLGGNVIFYTVNKDSFNALPPDLQEVVRQSMKEMVASLSDAAVKDYQDAIVKLKAKGVTIVELTPEERQRLTTVTAPLVNEWLKRAGPLGPELLDKVKGVLPK